MNSPRFSVIITSHNQRGYITDAVNSALTQGCADKEIIVVDDASSDGSPATLKKYGDKIRLAAFQTNQGANTARNLGVAMAKGEYFVFLDGDDVLLPWALDVYNRIVDARKPKIILSSMNWFEGPLPEVKQEETPHRLEFAEYKYLFKRDRRYQAGGSAIIVERQTFQSTGGWTDGFFPLDDVDLLMKLGYSGPTVQVLSPFTIRYRIHSSNTRHQVPKMIGALYKVIQKERSDAYPGGPEHRFDRYAVIGAPVLFWTKSAYRAGLYRTAMGVMWTGWPMFLAASARKMKTVIGGATRAEEIAINSSPSA